MSDNGSFKLQANRSVETLNSSAKDMNCRCGSQISPENFFFRRLLDLNLKKRNTESVHHHFFLAKRCFRSLYNASTINYFLVFSTLGPKIIIFLFKKIK